jgi:hypothetical protein
MEMHFNFYFTFLTSTSDFDIRYSVLELRIANISLNKE